MSISAVILLLILTAGGLALLFLLNYLLVKVVRKYGRAKQERFEAGNPPFDFPRKKLIMQYFGFVYLIVMLECALLLILLLFTGSLCAELALLIIIVAVVYTLTAIIVYRYAANLQEWT